MSADIILFVPRSSQRAERAFWKGREPTDLELLAIEIMNQTLPDQFEAPEKDPA